jgi:hypothetical protein
MNFGKGPSKNFRQEAEEGAGLTHDFLHYMGVVHWLSYYIFTSRVAITIIS